MIKQMEQGLELATQNKDRPDLYRRRLIGAAAIRNISKLLEINHFNFSNRREAPPFALAVRQSPDHLPRRPISRQPSSWSESSLSILIGSPVIRISPKPFRISIDSGLIGPKTRASGQFPTPFLPHLRYKAGNKRNGPRSPAVLRGREHA